MMSKLFVLFHSYSQQSLCLSLSVWSEGHRKSQLLLFPCLLSSSLYKWIWTHPGSGASTHCFINPSLVWRGGKIILLLSTRGTLITFLPLTSKVPLSGQFFFTPLLLLSSAVPKAQEAGIFCVTTLLTKEKVNIFRSTQITHLGSWYFILFRTMLICYKYSSFRFKEH